MAAAELLAITLRFGATGLSTLAGVMDGALGFVFGLGLLAVPVAMPASFVVGTLPWRWLRLDNDRQRYGALFGRPAALGSLVTGGFGPAFLVDVSNVTCGETVLREAVAFTAPLLPVSMVFAVVAAGWLAVPLSVFGEWYHEHAKARP